MVPEKQINEFIARLRQAAGDSLESIILYGSAATGEFYPDFSNVNLLVVLREASLPALAAIAPVVEKWAHQKHHPPLVLTREELERSSDVFSIEFLDMQQRHRVLLGDDPLEKLQIPMHLHRAQVEYELREKLILLRERVLLDSSDTRRLWGLLLGSLPGFTTLFRHALIELGEPPVHSKREAVQALANRIPFDPSAFLEVLDVREGKAEKRNFEVKEVLGRYLGAVQQVTDAVDRMLDSSASRT
ncbi:MAG TPA: nucleotidyltransferase domain-containing protein [Terriglobales bacterium]|nr:nucleotidyltransferase domain-containing protein [Terriglobales bacterium]